MKIPEINIGNTRMPLIGFGTWQLTEEECTTAVKTAIELGYNHIDTAHIYGNHEEIAIAIKDVDREKLFITSKVWRDDLTKQGVIDSGKRAVKELGIDYIDLFLIHWPNKQFPMRDTFDGLKELQKEGIIKEYGVSNFTIRHIEEAINCGAKVSVNQVEFHPLFYQKELLDYCNNKGIVITAYSPIGRGAALRNPVIISISEETGHSPAQVCLAWIMSKGVCVIPKSSSKERQEENLESLGIKLSTEQIRRIDEIRESECKRLIDPAFGEF